jgi:hypothetical protein
MKKLIQKLMLILLGIGAAYAQSPLSSTTLSGAANIVTPSLAGGNLGSILLVDAEAIQVTAAGLSSTCFNVKRGLFATSQSNSAKNHASGQTVWVFGITISTGDPSRPISTAEFLSQKPYQPFYLAATPTLVGGAASTSVSDVAGKIWYDALEVDFNSVFTGACVNNGATVGTDKWIMALYDSTGALIANTALAGTTTAGANQFQCIAFTSPVALLGPAEYFVALQGNGTTDNFKAYATGGAQTSYPTGSQTGTFGTLPAITVTNSFTTAVGPVATLF